MFKDLLGAFNGIKAIRGKTETKISNEIKDKIDSNANICMSAHREVGYYGKYHDTRKKCLACVLDDANTVKEYNDSMPIHVDLTLCNKQEIWLIEAKRQIPKTEHEQNWNGNFSNNVHELNYDDLDATFVYDGKEYFIDRHVGKVYTDICRLMSIKEHSKIMLRYFCIFYIDKEPENLKDHLLSGLKCYLQNKNVKNVITCNKNNEYSLWKKTHNIELKAYTSDAYKLIDGKLGSLPIFYVGADYYVVFIEIVPPGRKNL